MIELKEWTASEIEEYDDARLELAEDGEIDCTRVYIKADVDKVIAELKEKLKEQTSIAEEGWKEFRTYHTSYAEAVKELYDKNKEIADLEESHKMEVEQLLMEIVGLKKQVHDYAQGLYVMQARAEKEARHDKYKRCLRNAEGCKNKAWFYGEVRDRNAALTMWKWRKRWLKIAEQFKETK